MTCKDFSGKLFNSKDNEGNVVGSYLSNAEINGWVEAKKSNYWRNYCGNLEGNTC